MRSAPYSLRDRLRLTVLALAALCAAAGLVTRVASSHSATPPAAGPVARSLPSAPLRATTAPAAAAQASTGYKTFDGPQVHPLALTPDGTRLLAANSPNGTLSIFSLTSGTPVLIGEIPVGLEPVSVAARNDREAWVVNWLSDSVSIVDLATGNVTRTIDVGDEPTDILFAGTNNEKAFVCVSGGAALTPSNSSVTQLGRGQVKIFDASNPSTAPQVISIFGKQPRALARDATGGRVFVSVFESGNQTTIVPEPTVTANGGLPAPNPSMSAGLPAAPRTGLIVRWNGTAWVDELNRSWNAFLPYRLADMDVAVIDATTATPAVVGEARGVGTHNGNMVFDQTTNRLAVVNLESTNAVRFEPNLRGRFQASRVTFVNAPPGSSPAVSSTADLNPHVDLNGPGSDAERAQSLALPSDIARGSDGTLYVTATSSGRVGVLDPSGGVQGRVAVGSGPTGLALDEPRSQLYVLNRFDGTLSIVATSTRSEVARLSLGNNPEPVEVRAGRKVLNDANLSRHGTVSCASCHPGGHRDGLAWDLGDPRGQIDNVQTVLGPAALHPMKGPMTTQSLRGITENTPLHWRGDRAALANFNPAFVSLLDGGRQLTPDEMADFTAFIQSLTYPPNPNQTVGSVDRIAVQNQQGFRLFNGELLDGAGPIRINCIDCHLITNFRSGTNNLIIPRVALMESQDFKVPQMRGLYQKLGMNKLGGSPQGELTGFGFIHDGSFDTLFNFLHAPQFNFSRAASAQEADDWRRELTTLMLVLDTGTAPAVGMMTTVTAGNKTAFEVTSRLDFFDRRANAGDCDVVVRGLYGGAPRGFLRLPDGRFQPDSLSEPPVTRQALLDAAGAGAELTFMGVPVGAGRRMALDSDGDGVLNDDEPRTSVQITGRVTDAAGSGVSGVTVTLGGTQSAVARTDASGRFTFGMVSTTGTHTITPTGAGLTFSPASRSIVSPVWNQTAYFLAPATTANAIDASSFFVTQHYNDFFGRDPDPAGFAFWSGQLTSCGLDNACLVDRRVNVSAAFYLSIEFQQTGFFVHRLTEASFTRMPRFGEFFPDTQRLSRGVVVGQNDWQARLEANREAFVRGWVERPAFRAVFDPLGNQQYVDRLVSNAGLDGQIDKTALVAGLNAGTKTRAAVLREVAEHTAFSDRQKNRAFVLMQYLGYLRRNPDDAPEPTLDFQGFNFWLQKLNDHGGNFVEAQMVQSFLVSQEYRGRFKQ